MPKHPVIGPEPVKSLRLKVKLTVRAAWRFVLKPNSRTTCASAAAALSHPSLGHDSSFFRHGDGSDRVCERQQRKCPEGAWSFESWQSIAMPLNQLCRADVSKLAERHWPQTASSAAVIVRVVSPSTSKGAFAQRHCTCVHQRAPYSLTWAIVVSCSASCETLFNKRGGRKPVSTVLTKRPNASYPTNRGEGRANQCRASVGLAYG